MATIVDYAEVQQRMAAAGFVSLYHNSGAWGFPRDAQVDMLGWIGPNDPTVREAARAHVRQVPEPHAATLAQLLVQAWQPHLGGDAWLSPKSHWHYELHFGNRALLESLLPAAGVEPALLRDRNDGSALCFTPDESPLLRRTVEQLLANLSGSDFLLVFPGHRTVCTIHHHQQLWWQTSDGAIAQTLGEMVR